MEQTFDYDNVVLDIEGTVCPISFVKEELFPYFLKQLPEILNNYEFPLSKNDDSNDPIVSILTQFDENIYQNKSKLVQHITQLVNDDVKDPTLKSLQGFIWENGYTNGSIMAPLFEDAIEAIKLWSGLCDGLYIYSSGSVKAQKLLFGNVKIVKRDDSVECADFNGLITDYFDTVNIGKKTVVDSYVKILDKIGIDADDSEAKSKCLFLSDNPLEVEAAIKAGMTSFIIDKPGNYELSDEDREKFKVVTDFKSLFG